MKTIYHFHVSKYSRSVLKKSTKEVPRSFFFQIVGKVVLIFDTDISLEVQVSRLNSTFHLAMLFPEDQYLELSQDT